MLCETIGPFTVELWAKKGENGEVAVLDDGFLYDFSLGKYGSKIKEEDGKDKDKDKENEKEGEESRKEMVRTRNMSGLVSARERKHVTKVASCERMMMR